MLLMRTLIVRQKISCDILVRGMLRVIYTYIIESMTIGAGLTVSHSFNTFPSGEIVAKASEFGFINHSKNVILFTAASIITSIKNAIMYPNFLVKYFIIFNRR